MQTPTFDLAIRQIAVLSISGYQKYISPKKGFSCAHRVLYGGESCSQYIKRTIAQSGLSVALKATRERFTACKQANQILKTRYSIQSSPDDPNTEDSDSPNPQQKPRRRSVQRQNGCQNPLSDPNCYLGCDALDCGTSECPLVDCSGVDCSGLDCSSLDCGQGLDCSGADCGSCSYL